MPYVQGLHAICTRAICQHVYKFTANMFTGYRHFVQGLKAIMFQDIMFQVKMFQDRALGRLRINTESINLMPHYYVCIDMYY